MDILYIVMPAYNEEDNILDVANSWYPVLEGKDPASRLVIADSGSQDRTHELLEEFKKDHPQLEVLSDTGKQHGPKRNIPPRQTAHRAYGEERIEPAPPRMVCLRRKQPLHRRRI